MKNKQIAAMCSAVLLLMTACKKEVLTQSSAKPSASSEVNSPKRNKNYQEGIMSFDYFDAANGNSASLGYYRILGSFPGQAAQLSMGTLGYSPGVFGFGATTSNYVIAYKTTNNIQYLDSWLYGSVAVTVNSGANFLYSQIEEIEINPADNMVYAIVQSGAGKAVFKIDMTTGYATRLTVNGGSNIFNNTSVNGYKWGSIAFVPDGSGGYELVYSHESTVYASSGVVSWHFTISGTNLTSNTAAHHTYTGLPSGTGINTTYGNGKLYFARNGSSNALYSLSLTAGVNTVSNEGISITNTNDFGYYKAF